MHCAWSSSGGKDSLLALWYARQQGHRVTTMITMFDETGARSRSHGIDLALMREQASALDVELINPAATWKSYETEFVATLRMVQTSGCEGVVFGDIDLAPHREWEEKVCAQANLTALLPLWHRDRSELAAEVLRLGFKAIVVCVDHKFLGAEYCGREYTSEFVQSLPKTVDACGENGEFHTFVYDGPMFSIPLKVSVASIDQYQAPVEFGGGYFSFARLARSA
jgi:diphthine-ammonia ligase